MRILQYIKLTPFIKENLPHIKNVKYKISGKGSNRKDIDFTPQEKQEIMNAINKMIDENSLTKDK